MCPPPEAVRAAIFQLTSAERRRALPPLSRLVVSDEGQSYRVSVTAEGTTAQKKYTDPSRDCARRTRFAAVFAILTLMPPELEPEPEPEPEPSPEPKPKPKPKPEPTTKPEPSSPGTRAAASPAPKPARAGARSITLKGDDTTQGHESGERDGQSGAANVPRTRPVVRLELVGLGEAALGAFDEPRVQSLGGELRALLARSDIAPLLTFGFAPTTRLQAGRVDVDVQRLQAGLGVRAQTELGPFDLGGDLSLLGGLERIQGVGLEHPASEDGFELGLRAAALVSLASGRAGPLLALHASVFPAPNTFEALPRGEVGHMPHVWVGLSVGAFLGL